MPDANDTDAQQGRAADTPQPYEVTEADLKGLIHDEFAVIMREPPEDVVSAVAKNLDEAFAEQVTDAVERAQKEWEKKTETEKQDAMKAAMSGQGQASRKATGKENLWFMKGDDPDYKIGDGHLFADTMPFLFKSKMDYGRIKWPEVIRWANDGIKVEERTFRNKAVARTVEKALESSTVSAGGALVPEELSQDFIGFLYDQSVVRQAGARTLEMPFGQLDLGRQSGSATAYWVGENSAITASNETYDRVRLDAKKLGVLVAMSNDLIRRVPRGFAQLVRDDMVTVAQLKEDLAFIRGTGTAGEPQGIRNAVDAAQTNDRTQAGSDSTTAEIVEDLMKAIYLVRKELKMLRQAGWIMHSRTQSKLSVLRDGNDNLSSFMAQLAQGQLFGFPVHISDQIPTGLDASGDGSDDETEVYFGDFAECIVGETLNVRVDTDTSGTVGSDNLFEQDMQALRLIHEVDFALRHDKAFSVIEAVDWGASFDS